MGAACLATLREGGYCPFRMSMPFLFPSVYCQMILLCFFELSRSYVSPSSIVEGLKLLHEEFEL
jgi:hypothetical protein